jgi:hypothetical protein
MSTTTRAQEPVTLDDAPTVVILSEPEPPPAPAPPLSERIVVTMPRVRVRLLRDWDYEALSFRLHSAYQRFPFTGDPFGRVLFAGTILVCDQSAADQVADPPPIIGPVVEILETLPETVERRLPRLRGQQGDQVDYAAYCELRDQLIDEYETSGRWRWVAGEVLA